MEQSPLRLSGAMEQSPLRLSGAIFDLDGTLLDSMSCWSTLASDYLKARGLVPEPGLDSKVKEMSMSQSARYISENYLPQMSERQIMEDTNASVKRFYRDVFDLKPGVRGFLERLIAHRIPMCVITATDLMHAEAALKRLGIWHYFKEIYTCTEFGSHKDEPEIFEAALLRLGTSRESTVVFEDALYALRVAKAAGYPTVAVYDSCNAPEWSTIRELADETIEDWNSLEKAL
jgi:thiamine-phosphate pyrophosphorylase